MIELNVLSMFIHVLFISQAISVYIMFFNRENDQSKALAARNHVFFFFLFLFREHDLKR